MKKNSTEILHNSVQRCKLYYNQQQMKHMRFLSKGILDNAEHSPIMKFHKVH